MLLLKLHLRCSFGLRATPGVVLFFIFGGGGGAGRRGKGWKGGGMRMEAYPPPASWKVKSKDWGPQSTQNQKPKQKTFLCVEPIFTLDLSAYRAVLRGRGPKEMCAIFVGEAVGRILGTARRR